MKNYFLYIDISYFLNAGGKMDDDDLLDISS